MSNTTPTPFGSFSKYIFPMIKAAYPALVSSDLLNTYEIQLKNLVPLPSKYYYGGNIGAVCCYVCEGLLNKNSILYVHKSLRKKTIIKPDMVTYFICSEECQVAFTFNKL